MFKPTEKDILNGIADLEQQFVKTSDENVLYVLADTLERYPDIQKENIEKKEKAKKSDPNIIVPIIETNIKFDFYGPALWNKINILGVHQEFRYVPPGEFLMGSPPDELKREKDEEQHIVELTVGYWIADTACTQELWQAVMGSNPSRFNNNLQNPVENVSWNDCQDFIKKVNEATGLTFDLPTEAQWERACRAGTETPFSFGENINTDQVNYDGRYPYKEHDGPHEYRQCTVPVKSLPANQWLLYEMHGNVWEWCSDWYGPYFPEDEEE